MQKVIHKQLTYDRVDSKGWCRLKYRYPDGLKPLKSTGKKLLSIKAVDLNNYEKSNICSLSWYKMESEV
jgi:hypothetical protein